MKKQRERGRAREKEEYKIVEGWWWKSGWSLFIRAVCRMCLFVNLVPIRRCTFQISHSSRDWNLFRAINLHLSTFPDLDDVLCATLLVVVWFWQESRFDKLPTNCPRVFGRKSNCWTDKKKKKGSLITQIIKMYREVR